jgi:hypothetical protein
MVLSMLPVAMYFASGLQLTHNTQLLCPFNVCIGVSVSQSHILAVPSPLPVAILEDEAGENCAVRIASP